MNPRKAFEKALLDERRRLKSAADVGRHSDVPDDEFDKEQLAKGIKVEKEHTDDPDIAKEIAKDHLTELKDYYTRLEKMEEGNKHASSLRTSNWETKQGTRTLMQYLKNMVQNLREGPEEVDAALVSMANAIGVVEDINFAFNSLEKSLKRAHKLLMSGNFQKRDIDRMISEFEDYI